MLTPQQLDTWARDGYLVIPDFYSDQQIINIRRWVEDLSNYPLEKGKWMLYYEQSLLTQDKILCRVENFVDYHNGLHDSIYNPDIIIILNELFGEPPFLFKEKINFKYPGGNGFKPHQDAPAYQMFEQSFHITVMICVDDCNETNGCLSFSPGRHKEGLLPQSETGDISEEIVSELQWKDLHTKQGDIVFFDSYVPHKSGPNISALPRRAIFATFNKSSDLDRKVDYYTAKRTYFPPENERVPGYDYSKSTPFNLGNPIK